jgi:rRNA maturation endonuclease Nob1
MNICVVCLIILEARIMSVEVLEDIRKELRELRLLYKELVEKLITVEKPSPEEREAIEEKDEVTDEEELMKALGKTNVRHKN